MDEDLGEKDVGVTILSYPRDIAKVMSICRWPLSQTILDSYQFFELLAAYDDHHVFDDDDKGTTSVKKKQYFFIKIKQKDLDA